MTGANHVATGAVIGASLAAPIAVPVAIASHFALDALPHFGDQNLSKRSKRFLTIIVIDALLVVAIVASIITLRPHHWQLMLIGGVLAASPDLMWAPGFTRTLRQREHKPHNRLMNWHRNIQREYAWGLITEVAWLVLITPFLVQAL